MDTYAQVETKYIYKYIILLYNRLMNCYIIGYDLRGERDYDNLYKAIMSYGIHAPILQSQWAIVTRQSAKEVGNYLRNYIDSNDSLFVAKITRETTVWHNLLSKEEGDKWLCDHL